MYLASKLVLLFNFCLTSPANAVLPLLFYQLTFLEYMHITNLPFQTMFSMCFYFSSITCHLNRTTEDWEHSLESKFCPQSGYSLQCRTRVRLPPALHSSPLTSWARAFTTSPSHRRQMKAHQMTPVTLLTRSSFQTHLQDFSQYQTV